MRVIVSLMSVLLAGTPQLVQSPSRSVADSILSRLPGLPNDTVRVTALNRLASELLFTKNDSTLDFVREALQLSKRLQYAAGMQEAYNTLGIWYGMHGDYPQSLENFMALLHLYERNGNLTGQAGALSNMAKIYMEQQNFPEARRYMLQALKLDEQRHDTAGVASDYTNLGIIEKRLKNLDEALRYEQLALGVYHRQRDTASVAVVLMNIGGIYVEQQRPREAIPVLEQGEAMFRQTGNLYGQVFALRGLGLAYKGLGDTRRAIDYLQRSNAIALREKWLEQMEENYRTLAGLYAASGDFNLAYEQERQYQAVHDSLFNQQKTRVIEDIKEKYETEKREQRIAYLEQEAVYEKRLKIIYLVAGILAVGMCILIIAYVRNRNRILKREKAVTQHRLQLEQERGRLMQQQLLQEQQQQEMERERVLQEQERAELEKQRLALELDENNRQLLTTALQLQQSRELLTEFEKTIAELRQSRDTGTLRSGLEDMIKEIRQQRDLADDWEHIKMHFEKVHPAFFTRLKEQFPTLTQTELKLCAYTRMNFTGKEIGRLLNINPASVQVARYRLKKKMNLPEEMNFTDFVLVNF